MTGILYNIFFFLLLVSVPVHGYKKSLQEEVLIKPKLEKLPPAYQENVTNKAGKDHQKKILIESELEKRENVSNVTTSAFKEKVHKDGEDKSLKNQAIISSDLDKLPAAFMKKQVEGTTQKLPPTNAGNGLREKEAERATNTNLPNFKKIKEKINAMYGYIVSVAFSAIAVLAVVVFLPMCCVIHFIYSKRRHKRNGDIESQDEEKETPEASETKSQQQT